MPQPSSQPADTTGARKLYDFFTSMASKRLAMVCFGLYKFLEIGLGTMESHAYFALGVFALAASCIWVYVWSETRMPRSGGFSSASNKS